jgi:hypothetical protein
MMMQQIALVSTDEQVDPAELSRVGAALQKQVLRDVTPLWGVSACVAAFPRLEELPLGYWPILLSAQDASWDASVHLDDNGQPYARVPLSPHWSHEASRACLELLVNPLGERCVSGTSLREDQGLVAYLLDVCAASAQLSDGYTIDGVLVSDFCTPAYFVRDARLGERAYSFHGSLDAPLALREGGRLTWFDQDSNSWWLRTRHGERCDDRKLGPRDRAFLSVRELVGRQRYVPSHESWHERARLARGEAQRASYARARRLRALLGLSKFGSRADPRASTQVQPVLRLERPSAPPPLPSPGVEVPPAPPSSAPSAPPLVHAPSQPLFLARAPEGALRQAEVSYYEVVEDAELERLIVEVEPAPEAAAPEAPAPAPEALAPEAAAPEAPAPAPEASALTSEALAPEPAAELPAPVSPPASSSEQAKRPPPRTAKHRATPRRAPTPGLSSGSSLAPSLAFEREPRPSGLRDAKLLAVAAAVGIGFFALVSRERARTHAAPRVPATSAHDVMAASALPLAAPPQASPASPDALPDAGPVDPGAATAPATRARSAAPRPESAAATPKPAKRKALQARVSAAPATAQTRGPDIEDLLDTRR